MADTGIVVVCLLVGVCAVVLALLLMAGDVERNPGPTGKEGIYDPILAKMAIFWSQTLFYGKLLPLNLSILAKIGS